MSVAFTKILLREFTYNTTYVIVLIHIFILAWIMLYLLAVQWDR